MKTLKNSSGFSLVHTLLLLVVVGIVGFTGWYVWSANQNANKNYASANHAVAAKVEQAKKITAKEYKDKNYKFSFKYPSNWTLKTQDKGAVNETAQYTVSVTSPIGTVVSFYANQGGKGGDCADPEANDERSPRTCYTYDVLNLNSFPSGLSDRTFYYYEAKVSPPTSQSTKAHYEIGISDDSYRTPTVGSFLTDVNIDIIGVASGDINISVDAGDSTSISYLTSKKVKEAKAVLETLRLSK